METLLEGRWVWVYLYPDHNMPGAHSLSISIQEELGMVKHRARILSSRMVLYLDSNDEPYCIYLHESLLR